MYNRAGNNKNVQKNSFMFLGYDKIFEFLSATIVVGRPEHQNIQLIKQEVSLS